MSPYLPFKQCNSKRNLPLVSEIITLHIIKSKLITKKNYTSLNSQKRKSSRDDYVKRRAMSNVLMYDFFLKKGKMMKYKYYGISKNMANHMNKMAKK